MIVRQSRSGLFRSMLFGSACVVLLSHATFAADIEPSATTWQLSGKLTKEEAPEISGLRCIPASGKPLCLMVADETRFARLIRMDGTTLVVQDEIDLLPPTAGKEADAEGVDIDNGVFYATGSHGYSKGGKHQPTRYFVYRLSIDPTSGKPSKVESSGGLLPIMEELPELRNFVNRNIEAGEKPGEHGLNIEGLIVRDGQAQFGLRGPVQDGTAYVVSVAVEALFGNSPSDAQVHKVRLGKGIGIRDMAKVEGGILILSGPEAEKAGNAAVFFWNGSSDQPKLLGNLAPVKDYGDAKPEALLVLAETSKAYRVLVLSDSVENGQPREYLLSK